MATLRGSHIASSKARISSLFLMVFPSTVSNPLFLIDEFVDISHGKVIPNVHENIGEYAFGYLRGLGQSNQYGLLGWGPWCRPEAHSMESRVATTVSEYLIPFCVKLVPFVK